MRLDRFLWWARLTKTRHQAQALAERGFLRLDGRRIDRAHAHVRVGSVIGFAGRDGRIRILRVETLPARRGPPAEARGLYAELANDSQQAATPLTPENDRHSEDSDTRRDRLP